MFAVACLLPTVSWAIAPQLKEGTDLAFRQHGPDDTERIKWQGCMRAPDGWVIAAISFHWDDGEAFHWHYPAGPYHHDWQWYFVESEWFEEDPDKTYAFFVWVWLVSDDWDTWGLPAVHGRYVLPWRPDPWGN